MQARREQSSNLHGNQAEPSQPNWKLVVAFTAIGLLQGYLIETLTKYNGFWGTVPLPSLSVAACVFVVLSPLAAYLVFDQTRPWASMTFAFALGFAAAVAGGINSHNYAGDGSLPLLSFWFLIPVSTSAILMIAWFGALRSNAEYQSAAGSPFIAFSTHMLIVAGALCLTFAIWAILTLWAGLFAIAGWNDLANALKSRGVILTVTAGAFGLGYGLLRQQPRALRAARNIVLVPFSALSTILALGSVTFAAILMVAGPEPVWSTGLASPILIGLALLGVLLTNAVVREGPPSVIPSRLYFWVSTINQTLAPLLVGLAAYSLWLRVEQYGLTPARVGIAFLISAFSIVTLSYLVAVLIWRANWPSHLAAVNRFVILVVAGLLISTLTPPLNPFRLSAENQVERLTKGVTDPSTFDYGLLKYELGQAGRDALERIRAEGGLSSDPLVVKELERLDQSSSYRNWRTLQKKEKKEAAARALIPITNFVLVRSLWSQDHEISPEYQEFLVRTAQHNLQKCRDDETVRCAIIAGNFVDDIESEYVLALVSNIGLWVGAYRRDEGEWKHYATSWQLLEESTAMATWQAIKNNDLSTAQPTHLDLRIGDITVGLQERTR